MIIDRSKALGWLQPMLDELGINVNVLMGVRFEVDRVVIKCAHTPDPDASYLSAVSATGQMPDGLADMSVLSYEVELEIADLVAKS